MKEIEMIRKVLTPDLLRGRWKEQRHPMEGHCYVAAEALYHLLGKRAYKVMRASYTDEKGKATHWWLEHRVTGKILDPTVDQFAVPPYKLGKATGFLTSKPSKRAQVVLDRIKTPA